eukprot:TRINITY_DN3262_c0_g1_i1.p1 TRINITY_DN3262_c0_g1~~TRINITY_DN3262_c0_g1_i1.p1  ORF type:complete len:377 (+),score=76.39 TRINITY_DN3262_c0_g1_i1:3-1133(+)
MGIKGLMNLIADNCPDALVKREVKHYFGRKIAIDSSMALYSFLVTIRQENNSYLTDSNGETTSHLIGMFSRAIKFIREGMKPVFVFDGKPPDLKSKEIQARRDAKDSAQALLDDAKESGDIEQQRKLEKRVVSVTKKHNDEAKKLLKLMGIPIVEAPCEAEAQCAQLCKDGKVFAVGSEDMDTVTFASPILLRNLNYAASHKKPIIEVHYDKVLEGLNLTQDQFTDLCILLGCDFCKRIKGIGPKKALILIRKWKTLEGVLKHIDKKRYVVPEYYPFEATRLLFKDADVTPSSKFDFEWKDPDEKGLIEFLVKEKGFSEKHVLKGCETLRKKRRAGVQGRVTDFFTVKKRPPVIKRRPGVARTPTKSILGKRKRED